MKKAFKFRIYPTKKQVSLLDHTLSLCCELYNCALEERRSAYRIAGISISYLDQQNQLPDIKKTRQDLKSVHSLVLQDVLRRLDRAFEAFFRRLNSGERAGYPRFRSRTRYDSFTYTQSGFEIINGRLSLSKIGHIKIKLHRPVEGQIKTCTIRTTATGKWYACFSVEVQTLSLPSCAQAVGIDVGLHYFAALTTGKPIENPRFFRAEEKELAKVQRKLSAAGSHQHKQRRKTVARVHERIANKRADFAHQQSSKVVKEFGIICVEDLMIRNMVNNHSLAKSIADAAWSMFFQMLTYKAECAGRKVEKVPSAYTTQDCHRCGHRRDDLSLADRIYHCTNPECLLVIDRDLNSALNILALGLQRLGLKGITLKGITLSSPIEAARVYAAE